MPHYSSFGSDEHVRTGSLSAGCPRVAHPLPLKTNLETLGGVHNLLELLQDKLQLLVQLLWRWPLAKLHSLYMDARRPTACRGAQGATEHVSGVHLHFAVAEGYHVAGHLRVKLSFDVQEGLSLPPVPIVRELDLESVSRRDDLHVLQQRQHRGEVLRSAVLDPAAHRVRDDEDVADAAAALQKPHDRALDAVEVVRLVLVNLTVLEVQEGGAEQGVVPI
mmetsp:Transcript_13578/g.42914  ORF Transcript_13578/g.42914 Transcript_13578/m.42914 type:complete len:220 (-) Transcript_13578:329-988(-)